MSNLTQEVKQMIIDVLMLEDTSLDDIEDDAPLFGDGLGLDSIDALELGVALKKRYNIQLNAESDDTKNHFKSVNSLVELIATHQA
ncbi:phosphopantetheine-binding protein [Moraxella sp. ZY210820]|uniref:phosphopantetheine-binding protein n=1 Tax=unclassified Moraxella TaxID=2685852 RepID=UPI002730C9B3|nr:phosphopantetheine-binding protein [Moraxella sp. ZY210820]WLF84150.1 phosphopantetheine-binding protein [Moraxella sp. ZY210820]